MTRHTILKKGALMLLILAYTIGVCMLESCSRTRSSSGSDSEQQSDASGLALTRLDLLLADHASLDSAGRSDMIGSFSAPLGILMAVHGYPSVSDSALTAYSASAATRVFSPDVRSSFPNGDVDLEVLPDIAASIDRIASNDVPTRLFTFVTPFNQSIVTADSIVLIGLNHYLGADYPGYEGIVPSYMLSRKTRAFLPYALAEGMLVAEFPFVSPRNPDLLSRMLYGGALLYAEVEVVPDGNVADALSWTDAQYSWAETHEAEIWKTIIGRNLLFSTSEADAARLLSPSPRTSIVSPEAPGQIGRYIGYCIVETYMKNHPDATLRFLLSPDFYAADDTLDKAAYHPR